MNDGTCYHGTVSDVRDGRCYLTDCNVGNNGALTLSALKSSGNKKKAASKKKATVSGLYGGYGYGGYGYGGSYWLDFALIASLFLLPFFFF